MMPGQAFALFRPLMADLRFFVTQEGILNQGGSGNDTVFHYTGILSANTVKGAAGNDLLSFANQTTAATIRAISNSAGTAGSLKAIYSGAYESAGSIAESIFTAETSQSAGRSTEVSAAVQTLQLTGITTVRKNSLFAAGAGDDSIFFGDQITTFNDVSVRGGKGNDIVGSFNSGGATTGILSHLSGGELKGGKGNDTVYVNLSGESATDFKLVGNAGTDTVMFSGGSAEANSGFIGGGAGNDSVIVVAQTGSKTTVNGGKGNDSIDVTFSGVTNNGLFQGGTDDGDDTIRLALDTYSSTSVYGGGGNDSIVVSGVVDNGSNIFDAGTGNDTVFFQSAGVDTISGSTILGGAGNDSILIQSMSAGVLQSGLIEGGAGNDTITVTDLIAAGSAGVIGKNFEGGAGSDSITLSAVGGVGGGASGTFSFSGFSESTLSSMDTLTFNTAAISADTDAAFGSSKIHIFAGMGLNTGVSGAGAVGQVSASGGYVVWSGYSDNSLTARVSAIDAGYTTTGDFAVFTTDNTTRYLFIQGGSTDLVARLSNEASLSAGLTTITKSGNTIGFSH